MQIQVFAFLNSDNVVLNTYGIAYDWNVVRREVVGVPREQAKLQRVSEGLGAHHEFVEIGNCSIHELQSIA